MLAALDVVRAYLGTGLRPLQWIAGALVVAALWWWLDERGMDPRTRAPWVGLAALLVPTYVDHARVLDRGDSVYYYSFLRSLLFDGDLRFDNDFALLGWPEAVGMPNVLPVGAPLLWSPLVVLVHLGRLAAGQIFGFGAPDGAEPVYQATVTFATLLFGTAGLFFLMATLRRWVGPGAAFWATVIAWVGSPLRFYLSVLPGMAHGVEFFAAVLVLRAYLALRERPSARTALQAGAACGLVFLTRSQDGLLLLLPGVELAFQLRGGAGVSRVMGWGAAVAIAFLIVAAPQVAVWQAMFGAPVLIPHKAIHGDTFLHARPELVGALVSERGGLFASHPAMLVAVVGLAVLARRDVRYVLAVVPILIGTWYLNASVFDWYHVRRFTGVVPLLAPGLAVALAPIAGFAALAAVLAFAFLRYDVAVDTLRSVPGDPAPLPRVLAEMKNGLAADTYAVVEPVAPESAVKMMAAYTRQPVVGQSPVRIDLSGEGPVRLPVRARNLSASSIHEDVACRWVRGDVARVFVPGVAGTPLTLTIAAAPAEAERATVLEASWNRAVLGRQTLAPGWGEYRFEVPVAAIRSGTNAITFAFSRLDGPHRDVRRSAAVASLTVEPARN